MYDDSGKLPISSSKILLIIIIAIIGVMFLTVMLNGGVSNSPSESESTNGSDVSDVSTLQYKLLGSNSYGTVTKISGFGDSSSDIKVALILGVDSKKKDSNAIVSTLQNQDLLNYCYDVYLVNTTSISNKNATDNNNSLTVNEMSESLASEFVVPDIINNNYNFTVDVHSTNDSNSYLFVPSENTYTSRIVLDSITNNTNVGKYTPENHRYTQEISEKIISYEIPSIVYVTKEYYNKGVSEEISSVITTIDQFDFVGLFSSDFNSDDSSNGDVYVSNSSSGNVEVD